MAASLVRRPVYEVMVGWCNGLRLGWLVGLLGVGVGAGCGDDSAGAESSEESGTESSDGSGSDASVADGGTADDAPADDGSGSSPPDDAGDEGPLPCVDSDGDGFGSAACGGEDCNDASFWIHPDAADNGWGVTALQTSQAEGHGLGLTRGDDGRLFTIVTGAQPGQVVLHVLDDSAWTSHTVPAAAPHDPSIYAAPDGRIYAAFVSADVIHYGIYEGEQWSFVEAPSEAGTIVGTTITWNEIFGTGDYPGAGSVFYGREGAGHGVVALHGETWAAGGIEQWFTQGVNPDAYWWEGGTAQQRVISHDGDVLLEAYYTGVGAQGSTLAEDASEHSAIAGIGATAYWVAYTDVYGAVRTRRGSSAAFQTVLDATGAPTAGGPLDLYVADGDPPQLHAAFGGPTLRHGVASASTFVDNVIFAIEEVDAEAVTEVSVVAAPADSETVDILYWTATEVRLASRRPADGIDNNCDGVAD